MRLDETPPRRVMKVRRIHDLEIDITALNDAKIEWALDKLTAFLRKMEGGKR